MKLNIVNMTVNLSGTDFIEAGINADSERLMDFRRLELLGDFAHRNSNDAIQCTGY